MPCCSILVKMPADCPVEVGDVGGYILFADQLLTRGRTTGSRDSLMNVYTDFHGPEEQSERWSTEHQDTDSESRDERLARIQNEIACGKYDTPERFELALDRLFESINQSF